ncbi:MAG: thiamine phosphate synthase [Sulfurimonas sp. RIFOXYD12_FULL_33_39]|uniref:thiamine phosphate synthase n=1 Tax=unclassified Sulfurimonas TaxID=2623549 RepID=UPI0008D64B43|nr:MULTISPECIES: thiamine phosphate synthase [unclassified Sulfurimonas]OHE09267.1 MAG: thiamine phosphate synthase [Sulfurimonas sp. RIFOXYD12_FULL_33_39]OHE12950.1 MAG: thiamine phosphate synthase [Sulfurimonas sp. RIFOXYD2_FULL_34_21]DAB27826.1 MAG TPA: thiamine phosphate synthase [Sulfurimonas sp. UBA10385]
MNRYLITSRDFYGDIPVVFSQTLHNQLKKYTPEYVLYRDKLNKNYDIQAAYFIKVCSEYKETKSFLHQHVDLAKELNATGVHLTSSQFDEIEKAKNIGLEVIISTHTHQEVLRAQKLGADAVTYSPIFASPNKGAPKGIDALKELLEVCDISVFALGGIVDKSHVDMIEQTKAYGFASIRYFY